MSSKQSASFHMERKGYNRFEVDNCIKEQQEEIAALTGQIEALKQELQQLNQANSVLKNREAVIEDTIINAELTAKRILEEAEKKAAEISVRKEYEEHRKLAEIEEKKKELEDIQKRVKYILKSQLAMLERE